MLHYDSSSESSEKSPNLRKLNDKQNMIREDNGHICINANNNNNDNNTVIHVHNTK